MEGIATAAWMPYARPMDGMSVRRNGFWKAVRRRRVWSTGGMVGDWEGLWVDKVSASKKARGKEGKQEGELR